MLQDSAEIVESDTFSSTRTFPSSHRLGVDVFDVVGFSERSVDAAEAEGVIVIAVAIFVGSKGDEVLKGIGSRDCRCCVFRYLQSDCCLIVLSRL